MEVSLPEELNSFVLRQVEIGSYKNSSDVVSEGIRLLQERKAELQSSLREKVQEGIRSVAEEPHIESEQFWLEMDQWKSQQTVQ